MFDPRMMGMMGGYGGMGYGEYGGGGGLLMGSPYGFIQNPWGMF